MLAKIFHTFKRMKVSLCLHFKLPTAQLLSIIASDSRWNWSAVIQSAMTELEVYSTHVEVVSVSAQESKQAHHSTQKKKKVSIITTVMHKFQWFSKWDDEYKDIMSDEDYLVAEEAERACQV